MNPAIISPADLALASWNFWTYEAMTLADARQHALANGFGSVAQALEGKHVLALFRCQQARIELGRINGMTTLEPCDEFWDYRNDIT